VQAINGLLRELVRAENVSQENKLQRRRQAGAGNT
jgi:hypothetical protein